MWQNIPESLTNLHSNSFCTPGLILCSTSSNFDHACGSRPRSLRSFFVRQSNKERAQLLRPNMCLEVSALPQLHRFFLGDSCFSQLQRTQRCPTCREPSATQQGQQLGLAGFGPVNTGRASQLELDRFVWHHLARKGQRNSLEA